jgi:hypothetical protein
MWLIRLRISSYNSMFKLLLFIKFLHSVHTTHLTLPHLQRRWIRNFLFCHHIFASCSSPESVCLLISVQKLLSRCTRRRIECQVWRAFVCLFLLWDFKFPHFKPNMNYMTMVFGSTKWMSRIAVVTIHKMILIH